MNEQVRSIPISQLYPFQYHPFHVRDDEAMAALCGSIQEYGILSPLLARPAGEGYEVISGHRRRLAALKLGLLELPVLIRSMTDDEAVILMVDSNIQRENLLPSEKAFAYKMKLEAMKHQGRTSVQLGQKSSRDTLAESAGESATQIQRYIRLTHLEKPLLDLADEGRIALTPAVELSYLLPEEQRDLLQTIESEDCTPSLSQSVRMRKLSSEGLLTMDRIFEIIRKSISRPNGCALSP